MMRFTGTEVALLRTPLLMLAFVALTGYGCATGRAMTAAEMTEFEELDAKISAKRSVIASKERKLNKAFSRASIGISGSKPKLCGLNNSVYKTGKVPLVYGAKKRVIFSASGSGTQCRTARVEVKK